MTDDRQTKNAASEGTSESPCWPLPDAWSVPIPPQAVKIIEREPYPGMKETRPVWNTEWLRGLEAYVRSIVRDELSKANKGLNRRDNAVDERRQRLDRAGDPPLNNKTNDGGENVPCISLLDDAVWCLAHVWNEMNTIRARDGVPRMFDGTKSSVSQEWWDGLMNRCEAVIVARTGKPAHCNPVLYTSNQAINRKDGE